MSGAICSSLSLYNNFVVISYIFHSMYWPAPRLPSQVCSFKEGILELPPLLPPNSMLPCMADAAAMDTPSKTAQLCRPDSLVISPQQRALPTVQEGSPR